MASGNIYHGGLNFSGTEVTVAPNSENQSIELTKYTLDGVSGSINMPGYIDPLVPKMTSYTTPSGVVSESSRYSSGREGWHAFDQVKGTVYQDGWLPSNEDTAPYLIYKFTYKKRLSRLWIETHNNSTSVTKTLYVEGAIDPQCTQWENCLRDGDSSTITANNNQYHEQNYDLNNKQYYGIKISGDSVWMIVNGYNVCISRAQVYDIAFGNEVPDDNWSRNLSGLIDPSDSIGNDRDQYFKLKEISVEFSYLQFKVTATKGSDSTTQVSEIELYDNNGDLYDWTGTTVTCNVGCYSGYGPEKLINGSHSSMTDQTSAIIVPTAANPLIFTFELGSPFLVNEIATWKWYTAADAQLRDPISFSISASVDGETWYELDSALNASITNNRCTVAYTGNFEYPFDVEYKIDKTFSKIEGKWIEGVSGGGTGDYEDLDNLPSINNVTLIGNKTSEDLGIVITLTQSEYDNLTYAEKHDPNKVYYISDGGGGGGTSVINGKTDPTSGQGNDGDIYLKISEDDVAISDIFGKVDGIWLKYIAGYAPTPGYFIIANARATSTSGGYSAQIATFNLTSYSNYRDITVDNIYFDFSKYYSSGLCDVQTNFVKSYNPSSGELTMSTSSYPFYNGAYTIDFIIVNGSNYKYEIFNNVTAKTVGSDYRSITFDISELRNDYTSLTLSNIKVNLDWKARPQLDAADNIVKSYNAQTGILTMTARAQIFTYYKANILILE